MFRLIKKLGANGTGDTHIDKQNRTKTQKYPVHSRKIFAKQWWEMVGLPPLVMLVGEE
jgi:hypothetical protein